MSKITLVATSLILSAALAMPSTMFAQSSHISSLSIGSDIPNSVKNVAMQSTNGQLVTLSKSVTSEGLLVMFSCNTCPYVMKSQPRTTEMIKYAKKKGIGMLILNSNETQRHDVDGIDAMKKYAMEQNYTVPYLVDRNSLVADAFGASHTPEVFLFDKNGKLIYKGAMEDNPSNPENSKKMYLKDAIDAMMLGKAPDPNSTRSIGCGIKRQS